MVTVNSHTFLQDILVETPAIVEPVPHLLNHLPLLLGLLLEKPANIIGGGVFTNGDVATADVVVLVLHELGLDEQELLLEIENLLVLVVDHDAGERLLVDLQLHRLAVHQGVRVQRRRGSAFVIRGEVSFFAIEEQQLAHASL